MSLRFTILGCGSSGGVPRIGGHWGNCDPANPKNRRRRCSMLVERIGPEGITRVLIDASPDLREQLLNADVGMVDGVVFTHSHADHCHGIDDLRMVVINTRQRVNVWADDFTRADLIKRFGYVFETPDGSDYPPILRMNHIDGPFTIDGAGGQITLQPFTARHGSIDALGFRIEGLAYLPDANHLPEAAWDTLKNLDIWVIDALRRSPHPSHSHLDNTLEWITRAKPKRAVLTNMHTDLDYETLRAETPEHIEPAYDMMVLTLDDA